jgi:hypothetical protein
VFGVSSKASDGDNLIKSFQDTLCETYGFNDRDIYRWDVEKLIVTKGQEYVAFEIMSQESPHPAPGSSNSLRSSSAGP